MSRDAGGITRLSICPTKTCPSNTRTKLDRLLFHVRPPPHSLRMPRPPAKRHPSAPSTPRGVHGGSHPLQPSQHPAPSSPTASVQVKPPPPERRSPPPLEPPPQPRRPKPGGLPRRRGLPAATHLPPNHDRRAPAAARQGLGPRRGCAPPSPAPPGLLPPGAQAPRQAEGRYPTGDQYRLRAAGAAKLGAPPGPVAPAPQGAGESERHDAGGRGRGQAAGAGRLSKGFEGPGGEEALPAAAERFGDGEGEERRPRAPLPRVRVRLLLTEGGF